MEMEEAGAAQGQQGPVGNGGAADPAPVCPHAAETGPDNSAALSSLPAPSTLDSHSLASALTPPLTSALTSSLTFTLASSLSPAGPSHRLPRSLPRGNPPA